MPEVSVPLATYTGWNLRAASIGAPNEIYSMVGSFMPFALSRQARTAGHDPRPSVEERYSGKEDYLARIDKARHPISSRRALLSIVIAPQFVRERGSSGTTCRPNGDPSVCPSSARARRGRE